MTNVRCKRSYQNVLEVPLECDSQTMLVELCDDTGDLFLVGFVTELDEGEIVIIVNFLAEVVLVVGPIEAWEDITVCL